MNLAQFIASLIFQASVKVSGNNGNRSLRKSFPEEDELDSLPMESRSWRESLKLLEK